MHQQRKLIWVQSNSTPKPFSSWVIKTFFLHHGKIHQSLPSFSYFQNCCLTKLELCTH
jgi:hypothetical protein